MSKVKMTVEVDVKLTSKEIELLKNGDLENLEIVIEDKDGKKNKYKVDSFKIEE